MTTIRELREALEEDSSEEEVDLEIAFEVLEDLVDGPASAPTIVEPGETFKGLDVGLEAIPPEVSGFDPEMPAYRIVVRGKAGGPFPKYLVVLLWHQEVGDEESSGQLVYFGTPGFHSGGGVRREWNERPLAVNMCDMAWVVDSEMTSTLFWRCVPTDELYEGVRSILSRDEYRDRPLEPGMFIDLRELADIAHLLDDQEGGSVPLDPWDDLHVLWREMWGLRD